MTAPSIISISHAEAKEIAQEFVDENLERVAAGSLRDFADTGRIWISLLNWVALIADQGDERVLKLRAYCEAHGRRGPVEAGYRVTVTRLVTGQSGRAIPGDPERQEVATADEAQVATFNAVAELLPPVTSMGMERVNPAMEEFGPKAIYLVLDGGGTLEINGATVTVERVEGWSDV